MNQDADMMQVFARLAKEKQWQLELPAMEALEAEMDRKAAEAEVWLAEYEKKEHDYAEQQRVMQRGRLAPIGSA